MLGGLGITLLDGAENARDLIHEAEDTCAGPGSQVVK